MKKSPREVDLRVALFDDDSAMIVYDAEPLVSAEATPSGSYAANIRRSGGRSARKTDMVDVPEDMAA